MATPRYFVIQGCTGNPTDALDRADALHGGAGAAVLFPSPAGEATYGAIEVPAPDPSDDAVWPAEP